MTSTTIPNKDEDPTKFLEHAVDDDERFFHWLLRDHKLSESSRSILNVSSKDSDWLLQSKEIKTWKTDPHSVLWLHGTARSEGKTLCGEIVKQIEREKSLSDGLAYFPFSTDRERRDNSVICLRSLISQLCEDNAKLPFAVRDMSIRRGNSDWGSTDQFVLLDIVELLVSRQRRTFILIDAIEDAFDSKELVELLFGLAERKLHGLHLLLSSRPELAVRKALDPPVTVSVQIGVQYPDAEISLCIQEYLDYSPKWRRLENADKRKFKGWLLDEAHGNLLWITLCFKLLEDCAGLEYAQRFIQNLPKTIPGVYDRLLLSIQTRQPEARQALQWMAVSERPLYLEELAEAAILESSGSSDPVVRFSTSFEIAKTCAGLVSLSPDLDQESNLWKVTFVHHTLKDHLLSGKIVPRDAASFAISELEAQKLISHSCLGYLLLAIEDAPLSKMRRANFPLLEYVLQNWYKHMGVVQKSVPVPESTLDRAVKLLDARYAQRGHSEVDGPGSKGPEGPEGPEVLHCDSSNFPPPLYYASLLGLVGLVRKLILRGDQHYDSGGYFGTPLQAAAYGGHGPVIKVLVGKGVDVNAVSGFYGTALQAASYSGQYLAVGQLLDSGADVNSLSGHYGTPLQAAAYGGHAKVILLLNQAGGKDNIKGGVYGCALVAAAQGGHEEAMMTLIKNGTDINAEGNKDILNALYGASAKGHWSIVSKLLKYGADPNKHDEFGRCALEAAIQGGYPDVVQLLLNNKAILNRDSTGGFLLGVSALHMAVKGGHQDLVQQLLKRRVVNLSFWDEDGLGLTPLHMAVIRGYEAIAQLLLKHGVDKNMIDKDGMTALMMAAKGGHQSLVVLLLEHEADVTARNENGQTALMLAVEEGHEAIVFLLLQRGATADSYDLGRTSLDVAESKGHRIIEKLLDFGVSGTAVADRDRFWKSFSRIQTLPDD